MLFEEELKKSAKFVDLNIEKLLPKADCNQDEIVEAMKYSLTIGGKRIRPILCLKFAEMFGVSNERAMPFASAVEFIHTYSLIHDDLPCMDNDDLRRGKPSCHKKFREDTALLAGDALLTHSFLNVINSDFNDYQKSKAVKVLAEKSGVNGMIGGQVIDLKYENQNPSIEQILDVHSLKTGKLIECASVLGVIAGGGDEEKIKRATDFSHNLGIAFQIQDDILDVVGNETKLGKHTGSDKANNKLTYVSIVGIENARKDVEKYTKLAVKALEDFENKEFLVSLANYLISREF